MHFPITCTINVLDRGGGLSDSRSIVSTLVGTSVLWACGYRMACMITRPMGPGSCSPPPLLASGSVLWFLANAEPKIYKHELRFLFTLLSLYEETKFKIKFEGK